MALDIKKGDGLVVGNKVFPIKHCAEWQTERMNTVGFRRMAKTTAQIQRTKRNEPVILPTIYKCTPLDPVDAETRRRLGIDTPLEVKQTIVADNTEFLHLYVEVADR
jgi:hypothetical protein